MKYAHLTQADNWFYVSIDNEPLLVHRVVCWAQGEDSRIIGLISVQNGGESVRGGSPYLVNVPPIKGMYKHHDELTDEEKALADRP